MSPQSSSCHPATSAAMHPKMQLSTRGDAQLSPDVLLNHHFASADREENSNMDLYPCLCFNCETKSETLASEDEGHFFFLHVQMISNSKHLQTCIFLIRKLLCSVAFHLLTSELWHKGLPPPGQFLLSRVKRVWINQQVLYRNGDGLTIYFSSTQILKCSQVTEIL